MSGEVNHFGFLLTFFEIFNWRVTKVQHPKIEDVWLWALDNWKSTIMWIKGQNDGPLPTCYAEHFGPWLKFKNNNILVWVMNMYNCPISDIYKKILELPAKQHYQLSLFTGKIAKWAELSGRFKTANTILIFFNCHGCRLFIWAYFYCQLSAPIFHA